MARRGHHEGTISKRAADGRWVARISLPDGKRKAFYGKTRAEAQRKMQVALTTQKAGLPLADEQQTVATYLRAWVATLPTNTTLKPDTILRHRIFVEKQIIPALGRIRLGQLTALQVQTFYGDLIRESGLASTTVSHLHATLHKALDAAVRLGITPRNITDLVDAPRMRRIEMQVWTPEEARTFLRHATHHDDPDAPLYTLALATGMRQGELLGLRWRDIDWEHGVARIQATLKHLQYLSWNREWTENAQAEQAQAETARATQTTHETTAAPAPDPITRPSTQRTWWLDSPKNAGSKRLVRLSPSALAALRAQRAKQNSDRLRVGADLWQAHDFVFTNAIGEPLLGWTIYHRFLKASAAAGLPRIRFHDLRHTCATMLLSQRVNTKIVAEMLGHSSTKITSDLYSHVLPDMQTDAITAIEAVLQG